MKTLTKPRKDAAMTEIRPEVDYPQQDEKVPPGHYSFRVGAPEAADQVEVSVDQGPWQACRRAAGYWWFDWMDYDRGEHEVVSRARAGKGRWLVSIPHEFFVE
jgi:hypothetical protein